MRIVHDGNAQKTLDFCSNNMYIIIV